jgi:hypothetical protein
MAKKRSAIRSPAPEGKVEQAVLDLKKAYRLGKKIRADRKPRKDRKQTTIREEAEKLGINEDYISKMATFANPTIGFTVTELNLLCRWARQHGRIVGFPLVTKLLTIHSKQERMRFAENALEKGMSFSQVGSYLVQRFGRRKHGGRRPILVASIDDLLVGIEGRCLAWSRLYDFLSEPSDAAPSKPHRIYWSDLSPDLQGGITAIVRAAERLRGITAAHLQQPRKPSRAAGRGRG